MTRAFWIRSVVLAASTLAAACLPEDTRPVPGSLVVNASANSAVIDGIPAASTEDGWSIAYSRFLISIGQANLQGAACNDYSDTRYFRVLELRTSPGPQRLSLHYALGPCDFSFRVDNPRSDSVLGAGVTEADKAFMRTPAIDAYYLGGGAGDGVSLYVEGSATKSGVTKTFAWAFRQGVRYSNCSVGSRGMVERGVTFDSAQAQEVEIAIHGEALFQDDLSSDRARLRFAPFADADDRYGNADGQVELDELAQVPLADLDSGAYASDIEAGASYIQTLRDFVYLGLFPEVARFRDRGNCEVVPAALPPGAN